MRKRDDFEDDGRTIADMSGIGPAPQGGRPAPRAGE